MTPTEYTHRADASTCPDCGLVTKMAHAQPATDRAGEYIPGVDEWRQCLACGRVWDERYVKPEPVEQEGAD